MGFPDGSVIKNPPANTGDAGLLIPGLEVALEKEMANHSSIPAWKIPWTEEPCVHGVAELYMTERLHC